MNSERLETAAPDGQSVDFLVNVAPALGLAPEAVAADPSQVSQHYQTLLVRAEAAAANLEARTDRRMARLSAVVLGAYQKGGNDLLNTLKKYNFQIAPALLPAIVEHSAAWICEHLIEAVPEVSPKASPVPKAAPTLAVPSPRREAVQPPPPPRPASKPASPPAPASRPSKPAKARTLAPKPAAPRRAPKPADSVPATPPGLKPAEEPPTPKTPPKVIPKMEPAPEPQPTPKPAPAPTPTEAPEATPKTTAPSLKRPKSAARTTSRKRSTKPAAEHPDFAEPETKLSGGDISEEDGSDVSIDKDALVTSSGLSKYLRDIGKVPLLNAAQEVELCQSIEAGLYAQHKLDAAEANGISLPMSGRRDLQLIARAGKRANEHMIQANLRLVVSMAKRYRGRGMPFLDIIQEGNAGLMHAVKMFDYKQGNKFSTYATWWIRQAMDRSIKDKANIIRIPVHEAEKIQAATKAMERLQLQLGRPPTVDEIATELGETKGRVITILSRKLSPLSLDQTLGDDTAATRGDMIADPASQDHEAETVNESLYDQLGSALNKLTGRERQALLWLYGSEPLSVTQIAERLSMPYRTTAKLIARSTAKLAHPVMDLDPSAVSGNDPWQYEAACRQQDPEDFFPLAGAHMSGAVVRMCGACPVREACLDFALKNNIQVGVWGGTSARDRKHSRKQYILAAQESQEAESEAGA